MKVLKNINEIIEGKYVQKVTSVKIIFGTLQVDVKHTKTGVTEFHVLVIL